MVSQARLLLCYLSADATNRSRFATCTDGTMRFRAWTLVCSSHVLRTLQAGGFPRRLAEIIFRMFAKWAG